MSFNQFKGSIETDAGLVVYDLEVYPNYFLAAFKRLSDGRVLKFHAFTKTEACEPSRLSTDDRSRILSLMGNYTTFGFNSRNYDLPVIIAALQGWHTADLFRLSCEIIQTRLQGWQAQKAFDLYNAPIEARTFDIEEPSPSVMVSLKLYMARLNAPKLQDLPYEFDKWLTRDEAIQVSRYCVNDLDGTELLYTDIKPRMELRAAMSAEYGLNLMSKSDAQIAEAVIKAELGKMGIRTRKSPIPSTVRYVAPPYINFKTPQLQAVHKLVVDHVFEVNPSTGKPKLPKLPIIKIGDMKYKMGIGGLHSQEKAQCVEPLTGQRLIDSDVASYYPAIILGSGLYPQSLGRKFLDVYDTIVKRRLEAKRLGKTLPKGSPEQKAAEVEDKSLKITINGSFGKLGSYYSFLYAPDLMLAVTITGQLALLMLIERCHEAGLKVVSANTDGFVTLMSDAQYELYHNICAKWQRLTGFTLEETNYKGLYSRDVNNYVAVTTDGKAKGKGVFKTMGVDANPKAPIIPKAVSEYIQNGTPVEETIDACKDIKQFISVQRVNGGAVWNGQYLGRVARWVWVTDGSEITYKKSGNKVAKSDGARPVMDLTDLPVDLDYFRYYEEAEDLLERMGIAYHVL